MIIQIFLLYFSILLFSCDDNLRPAAIIPWSQYQRRLNKAKEYGTSNKNEENSLISADSLDTAFPSSYSGNYEKPQRQLSNDSEKQKLRSQYASVIRPQIRGRLPAEPNDFRASLKKSKVENIMKEKEEAYKDNYPATHTKNTQMALATSGMRSTIKMQPSRLNTVTANRIPSIAIPNGVPMYAANWETGQPHYSGERKPLIHAAHTYNGIDNFQLAQQIAGNEPSSPIYQKADANIVSSIFSESQARTGAIQTLPQKTETQAYFEKLLTDGASLNQISKLAQNLLGVGHSGSNGAGEAESSGGLLDVMTSALRGGNRGLPTSSAAHDPQDISAAASRPRPSVFEKLLSQAANALNDSLKNKELKEKAEEDLKIKQISVPAMPDIEPPSQKNLKLSKDKENSLKLLEHLPEDQKKILQAAIISGEIDPNSTAIKTLLKDDLGEESKKEKENMLLEWIRKNRPAKTTEVSSTSDKLPYYGRYLGSFAENPDIKKQLKPSGALWLVDEKRLIVSKFIFQPGSLLNENVTFWLGPKESSGNILEDIVPSENGFYVKPSPIDMSVFVSEELPPVDAKKRENVSSVKLLAGIPPIIGNSSFLKRRKRQSLEKPIEILVKGGVVQLQPSSNAENSEITELNYLKNSQSVIPAGFRLQQPEFDNIDENIPQPLDWYTGFQPLLLLLPAEKKITDLNWVSLRDHKNNKTVASILLPNGPLFNVPKMIQLRPFSPNNPSYNISSGPIQILDMKTIRINNFSFQTDDDRVWFMIGKDIIPNSNGHIVPIFDDKSKFFDCQSLKSYHNETVLLRLPGKLDMKDVFWFSVFSMKSEISYTFIYLPYNDMQLIPDLSSTPTPTCKYVRQ